MHIETITCMNCSKEIKPGFCYERDDGTSIAQIDWEGCTVKIHGGYSSDFDMQEFHGVICTECLKKAMPNLYQIKEIEQTRDKYRYFPKGGSGHQDFTPRRDPQDDQRLLDSILPKAKLRAIAKKSKASRR